MATTFQTRIPALSDAELFQYLQRFQDYHIEAVEAALAELDRRGLALSDVERTQIRSGLEARVAASQARRQHSFVTRLGRTAERRLARIRLITGSVLTMGLGAAMAIYLLTTPSGANPLGFEPEDSKKYLRDMEVYGGKGNLLASELLRGWNALWHGRGLAFTVGGSTILLTLAFWFIATRRIRDLEDLGDEAGR
jgi:hypothetical protein